MDHHSANNGHGHMMSALEIEDCHEEETDSLMRETAGQQDHDRSSFLARRLTFRKAARKIQPPGSADGYVPQVLRGFLRQGVGSHLSFRNFAVLATLAVCTLILLDVFDATLEQSVPQDTTLKQPPHQSSFGGVKNPGHYQQPSKIIVLTDDDGSNYFFGGSSDTDDPVSTAATAELLPKPNVGDTVLSLSPDNKLNSNAHYWHDPFHSPYASPLYKYSSNTSVTVAAQERYQQKMEQTVRTYGQWVPPDSSYLGAPDYDAHQYRDVPAAEFPDFAWQIKPNYLENFLQESKDLVQRVRRGIYAEYGYDATGLQGLALQEMLSKQKELFSVLVYEAGSGQHVKIVDGAALNRKTGLRLPGIAHVEKASFRGLVQKLLHAVVTSGEFYVVAAGPASTYRANNFFQSQVMQFNKVMEPVLDKLGVALISRNMGMDASSTVSALGGADIFGEADILWYVPDPRSMDAAESAGQLDLLHRQAILSGERVPRKYEYDAIRNDVSFFRCIL